MIKDLFHRLSPQRLVADSNVSIDLDALEKVIQYRFRDKDLLVHAMKHKSYLSVSNEADHASNERLELLGDAVLELITTEHLIKQFPTENEGELSQKRSVLVSRSVLGKLTRNLELGDFLLLNKGEEKTGGRSRPSNLANLFEAIVGAIYLDGGYQPAHQFVHHFLLSKMDKLLHQQTYFNFKSALLEKAQARGWGSPRYKIIKESGPDHNKRFLVAVEIPKKGTARGSGSSKKKAEQKAAAQLLQTLEQDLESDYGTQN